jgi:Zn-dependent metalloprotease
MELVSVIPGTIPFTVRTLDVTQTTEADVDDVIRTQPDPVEVFAVLTVSVTQNETMYQKMPDIGAIRYNAAIDAHYNACQFVLFMREILHVHILGTCDSITVLYGVRDKTGACYYRDGIIAIGIGDNGIRPASSTDVIGHELTHALCTQSGELTGEAGALHEHFADGLGTAFEEYVYRRLATQQRANWTIGESVRCGFFRSMSDPWATECPRTYRGRYWIDATSTTDHGGIHVNCGVGNYFFYLLSQRIGIGLATQLLVDVMYRRPKTYKDYVSNVLAMAQIHNVVAPCRDCLATCRLIPDRRNACLVA